MGKSDSFSKDLMQNDEYFADTVNNALFEGREVVCPNELIELDTTELTVVENLVIKNTTIQKYRDVLKQAVIRKDSKAFYAIIGIENQTSIHYAMPVKNLLYDAIRYAKQVEKKTAEYKNTKERLSKEEFLSGWKKTDKLLPIITITVYFGTEKWDGPKSIHEMFGSDVDRDVLKIIPNYRIHILDPNEINRWESFKSDIGLLFHMIAVSNNRGGISELIAKEPEHFQRVDNKIVKAINFYTKSNFPIEEGKEESDMCYATKTSEANAMIKALAKVGKSLKEIIDFIADEYPNDNDITEEYVIDEYNLVCANK